MKKKLLALIAVLCVAAMALAACGGGGSSAPAADTGGEAATEAPAETEAVAAGETYDVGDFTLTVPAGWKAFPQNDMFGDKDEDGNYPIDPSTIYVSRDAKDEWDLFSSPYVLINYQPKTTTNLSSRDSFYLDTEDLDVTIDGATIDEAYEGTSTILEDWRYQIIHFATDNAQFNVTIPVIIEGEESGYSISDPDIMAIVNSLAGK